MTETPPSDHDLRPFDEGAFADRELLDDKKLLAAARTTDVDLVALQAHSAAALLELAHREGIDLLPNLDKGELVAAVLHHRLQQNGLGWVEGVLEVLPDGFGFLRALRHDLVPGPDDVYVSPSQVRRLNLKPGHRIAGPMRPPRRGEKFFALLHVETIDGNEVGALRRRVPFAARTPVLPTERLRLLHPAASRDVRAIDRLAPWGKGQRVLITAPPGSGRTRLLVDIAEAILHNHQDVHVLACLLDERPEELTIVRRALRRERSDVVGTAFDEPPARHVTTAELALARCQRMVEAGQDVVLLFDSLTAFVRSSHLEIAPTGRLLCPGLDAGALLRPKRLYAAARKCEEGGSLTVIATALAGADSRVDAVIREEFANRGNSEVVLDPDLVALHVAPALDVLRTATRREDLLLDATAIADLQALRRRLAPLSPADRAAADVW